LKGAIICATGIGDGVIFSLLAHHLHTLGYEVTLFGNPCLLEIQPWFPSFTYKPLPSTEAEMEKILSSYDRIFVENDNSFRSAYFLSHRNENVSFIFPSYKESKHGLLHPNDTIFPSDVSMVEGLKKIIFSLSPKAKISTSFQVPSPLCYRKEKKRIVIHPTSQAVIRNWTKEKFLLLGKKLQKKGFYIAFVMSPKERVDWLDVPFLVPIFSTLYDLASYIYESGFFIGNNSGIGHLASLLQIPTLTLGGKKETLIRWKPDFFMNRLIYPYSWIPNFKHFRLREDHWQKWISPNRVIREFTKLQTQLQD
jgi:ADP-heptose:LPS heptosyltransferase